jgi:DNA topoisomerase-1
MSYNLVIVESPAKCNKIDQFLGTGYKCVASYGHLQELPSLKNIDISNNFKPSFTPIEKKKSQINKIKGLITQCKEVILATDDDREGEGIAWHICSLFNLSFEHTKRIIFHEITKTAITTAVKNSTKLDMNMVNAQQGRQILDLLVGFTISPVLWKNISRTKIGLSAGRCQTPALRLIYDNQKDIDNSPGKKVYNTTGYFTDKNLPFTLNHTYDNEEKMGEFLEDTVDHEHILSCEKPKNSVRKAPQPFITSTLQQTSSNELHISPKETMSICQKLYEGGYITYMRTDSKIYSKEFIIKANAYIIKKFGAAFEEPDKLLHSWSEENKDGSPKKTKKEKEKTKTKSTKDGNPPPQEAHEAIRPTNVQVENLPVDDFSSKEIRLYRLIWRTTVESCMADAIYKIFNTKITAPAGPEYRYLTEQIVFPGWKLVNGYEETNPIYNYLTNIKKGLVICKKVVCKLTMKDLKTHYTEAKLVQLLEQKGIGRPSTFSSLIEKIQDRGYVTKENIKGKTIICTDFELENDEITEIENKREFGNEKGKLVIQPIGIIVLEFLLKIYPTLFEYEYTKTMEDELDSIAKGNKQYYELCSECLSEIQKSSVEVPKDNKETIKIDGNHVYMIGKNGPVIKCIDDNKTIFKSVKKDIDIDKLRQGEYKLGDIVEDTDLNKKLGSYKNQDLILKKGKFGLYVIWGENKKSLNNIPIKESDIILDDVIPLIENTNNSNMIRELSADLSIRKGQYGDYIFYKTEKMTKPRFHKLNGFAEDYKTCEENIIKAWILEIYKINIK